MGSDSSSAQNTTQTTEDKRLVVEGGFGNTGALNAGNVSIVSQDKEFLEKSLKHLEAVNALDSERSKFLITEAGNSVEHLISSGEDVGLNLTNKGYDFASDLLASAEKTQSNSYKLWENATGAFNDLTNTGYQFANDLLNSAEKARVDSYKLGQDAISSAFSAVADFDNETSGQTLDNSQILAALIGAGALILVTR